MWLVVGLGNPGKKYEWTRHNVGFLAVEHIARKLGLLDVRKSEHKAFTAKTRTKSEEVILALPQTFMNLSGDSVLSLAAYYKVELENIVVLHDEVDLPFGQVKMQKQRGHGGHNGIRDIHKKLGSNEYSRLRIGVGRPSHPGQEVADFVLQNFSKQEMEKLPNVLDTCYEGVDILIHQGFERAATDVNSRKQI